MKKENIIALLYFNELFYCVGNILKIDIRKPELPANTFEIRMYPLQLIGNGPKTNREQLISDLNIKLSKGNY